MNRPETGNGQIYSPLPKRKLLGKRLRRFHGARLLSITSSNQRLMRLCRVKSCRSAGLITSGDTPGELIHKQVSEHYAEEGCHGGSGAMMSLTELKNMSMSVLMELAEKYGSKP